MKTAIVVMSDPKTGADEALGRLLNAFILAYDLKQKNSEVTVLFHGAGTRWAGEIVKPDHPAHGLYQAVKDKIEGVSSGCADVFGAHESAEKAGFELITESPIPGTSGVPSLASKINHGYQIVVF